MTDTGILAMIQNTLEDWCKNTAREGSGFDELAQLGITLAPLSEGLGGAEFGAVEMMSLVRIAAGRDASLALRLSAHYTALSALTASGNGQAWLGEALCKNSGLCLGVLFRESLQGEDLPGWLFLPDSHSSGYLSLESEGGLYAIPQTAQAAFPGSGLQGCRNARCPLPESILVEGVVGDRSLFDLLLGAVAVGNARGATAEALAYAGQRRQTGRLLIEHQDVRARLARCRTLCQASAAYLEKSATEPPMAASASRFARQQAVVVCNEAMQVFGGYGYMKDYPVEQKLRDALSLTALGGDVMFNELGISVPVQT